MAMVIVRSDGDAADDAEVLTLAETVNLMDPLQSAGAADTAAVSSQDGVAQL